MLGKVVPLVPVISCQTYTKIFQFRLGGSVVPHGRCRTFVNDMSCGEVFEACYDIGKKHNFVEYEPERKDSSYSCHLVKLLTLDCENSDFVLVGRLEFSKKRNYTITSVSKSCLQNRKITSRRFLTEGKENMGNESSTHRNNRSLRANLSFGDSDEDEDDENKIIRQFAKDALFSFVSDLRKAKADFCDWISCEKNDDKYFRSQARMKGDDVVSLGIVCLKENENFRLVETFSILPNDANRFITVVRDRIELERDEDEDDDEEEEEDDDDEEEEENKGKIICKVHVSLPKQGDFMVLPLDSPSCGQDTHISEKDDTIRPILQRSYLKRTSQIVREAKNELVRKFDTIKEDIIGKMTKLQRSANDLHEKYTVLQEDNKVLKEDNKMLQEDIKVLHEKNSKLEEEVKEIQRVMIGKKRKREADEEEEEEEEVMDTEPPMKKRKLD